MCVFGAVYEVPEKAIERMLLVGTAVSNGERSCGDFCRTPQKAAVDECRPIGWAGVGGERRLGITRRYNGLEGRGKPETTRGRGLKQE